MRGEIKVGTILMEDRPTITSALQVEGEPFSEGWSILDIVGGAALESKVGATGWRCFFLAGEVKATVFGSLNVRNSRRALRRILSKVRGQDFNCLEITRIVSGRFLGIRYTTMVANSRHIQQLGWMLQDAEERRNAQTDANWARG
jgi:hypothetical protein